MVPWLLPLGLLATVVLISQFGSGARLLMFSGGFVLLVFLLSIVYRPRDGEDPEVDYWRMRRR